MEWSLGTLVFCGYIAGSIPFGKIIGRLVRGLDISSVGSGNIGATNVAREVGVKWGILTLIMDCLKGLVPAAAAGAVYHGGCDGASVTALTGLAALAGHQFSVFLLFRGGKGVATSLGVFLVLCPLCVVPAVAVFALLVYLKGYISLASMGAAAGMPLFLVISDAPPVEWLAGVLIALLIIFAHRGNIARLIRKREPKWHNRPSS